MTIKKNGSVKRIHEPKALPKVKNDWQVIASREHVSTGVLVENYIPTQQSK
tara:strand:+ start:203 stop:355 length:153 start_codon:yes stop_codon:yes gene_type:complete